MHYKSPNERTNTSLMALFPGLPGSASNRKVKPIWILLKQETVSGNGISWAICKSAICIWLQTDNHASTPPLFLQSGCPSCRPTNSVKALKANHWYDMKPWGAFSNFCMQVHNWSHTYIPGFIEIRWVRGSYNQKTLPWPLKSNFNTGFFECCDEWILNPTQ